MRKAEHRGRPRNHNTQSFPYEPRVMGRRLVMPAELQRFIAPSSPGMQ